MGPRRAETVRLEQIETLVGRLGATETQVRMAVFPTVWPKSFRGHAAVRGVAGERGDGFGRLPLPRSREALDAASVVGFGSSSRGRE